MDKCVKCEEDATRTDLYYIWQKANFMGVVEIGICNDCIKPYLPRKTGKLIAAILLAISILGVVIILLFSSVETNVSWWFVIIMLFAPYQVYQYYSDYKKSGDVTCADAVVLEDNLGEIVGDIGHIGEKIVFNWQALQEKRESLKYTVSYFTKHDFMSFVRTPISFGSSPVELILVPENPDDSNLPHYLKEEDKELLIESIKRFRQEKIDAIKQNI